MVVFSTAFLLFRMPKSLKQNGPLRGWFPTGKRCFKQPLVLFARGAFMRGDCLLLEGFSQPD
jgi:hypothetical protein